MKMFRVLFCITYQMVQIIKNSYSYTNSKCLMQVVLIVLQGVFCNKNRIIHVWMAHIYNILPTFIVLLVLYCGATNETTQNFICFRFQNAENVTFSIRRIFKTSDIHRYTRVVSCQCISNECLEIQKIPYWLCGQTYSRKLKGS